MTEQWSVRKSCVIVMLAVALITLFFYLKSYHDMFGIVTDWVLNSL
ncbi:hypothetical protein P0W48_13985 [Plesiomonas shigelloides]